MRVILLYLSCVLCPCVNEGDIPNQKPTNFTVRRLFRNFFFFLFAWVPYGCYIFGCILAFRCHTFPRTFSGNSIRQKRQCSGGSHFHFPDRRFKASWWYYFLASGLGMLLSFPQYICHVSGRACEPERTAESKLARISRDSQ